MPVKEWMRGARFRRVIFSVRTFAGAMLALWIAFRLDLERPYWAVMTAFIVAQPLAGMVRSKSVYRIVGTVVGASVAVAAVPALVNAPLLLSLCLAGWISLCLYIALLDGTPRSYAFMLAGYTAAIIGFPSVNDPSAIFDTAVSRVEEITIGILCTTVLSELVFPERVGPLLVRRLNAWFAEVGSWVEQVLAGAAGRSDRARLAAAFGELETLRVHAGFERPGMPEVQDMQAAFSGLQRRMQMLLPLIDGIESRLGALSSAGRAELRTVLSETAAWIGSPETPEWALFAKLASIRNIGPVIDWDAATRVGLLDLLHDLVELWAECRDLRQNMATGTGARSERIVLEHYRDHGKAAALRYRRLRRYLPLRRGVDRDWLAGRLRRGRDGCGPVLHLRRSGRSGARHRQLPALDVWGAISRRCTCSRSCPRSTDSPLLVAALAPTYLLLGIGVATPGWQPTAMPLIINSFAPLALGEVYSANFAGFMNSVIAQAVGIGLALGTTKALRSSARNRRSAGWSGRAGANSRSSPAAGTRRAERCSRDAPSTGLASSALASIPRRLPARWPGCGPS